MSATVQRIEVSNPALPVPVPRGNHAAVVMNDVMYVFGGETNEDTLLDDFWYVGGLRKWSYCNVMYVCGILSSK